MRGRMSQDLGKRLLDCQLSTLWLVRKAHWLLKFLLVWTFCHAIEGEANPFFSCECVQGNKLCTQVNFSVDLKGKRKKHHGSDSSSSGGEISDLVQKLADKVNGVQGCVWIRLIYFFSYSLGITCTLSNISSNMLTN